MIRQARKWVAASALIAASGVGILSLGVAAPSGGVARAAAPVFQPAQETRRESVPPSGMGGAPITGPASQFKPLDDPAWGINYRANTDTQSPNLAQQEPSISVNPTNPLNVVAAAKDERGGTNTKQIWIYSSTDGGVTWINQLFPFGASSPFSSDPVVNFSDDGICYVTALPYGGGEGDGIQVARSTDGGITFSAGTQVTNNGDADKEWTWVDNVPSSPFYHRVYVAWMDFGSSPISVRFNYSTDRGATWSAQHTVSSSVNQFPMPVSLPNGDVIVTFRGSTGAVVYSRSTDGGNTFNTQQTISSNTPPRCPPDNSGCGIWRLSPIPATAVNRNDGTMVVMWADGAGGTATTRYSRSTNNGVTWSPSAILSASGVANTYQVEPWVEADEQGIFHAIWYDDRENPNTSIFHIYYSQSTDDGATWSPAVRISTATSDLRIGIPTSYSRAAGDYINVTASHGNVYATWTDTRSGTGEDVYVVRGTYSAPVTTPTPILTRTATATITNTATPTRTPQSGTPTPCPMNFSDVHTTDWFYEFVNCVYCRGAVSGYSDGTFKPFNETTRGQMTKIVVAAFAIPIYTPATPTFNDTPPDNPFYQWVETAAHNNIVAGYSDGTFRPFNNVTRGQLSKIVVIAAGWALINPPQATFSDVPRESAFYTYVETAYCHQIISGYDGGIFLPGNNATRAQIAKIVCLAVRNQGVCGVPPAR